MPRSKFVLNGWTDVDFYANAELRLVDKIWLSSVPYGEGEPYIVPSGWYRAVVPTSNCATYMVVSTRRGKSPSVLLLDIETREAVRLKTSARLRRAWEKLLRKAEWTNSNHIWDQMAAGTYERLFPEAQMPLEYPGLSKLTSDEVDPEFCKQLGIIVPFPTKDDGVQLS